MSSRKITRSQDLPKKVCVVGVTYKVLRTNDDELDRGGAVGLVDFNTKEIWVHSKVGAERAYKVLCHEFFHAVLNEMSHPASTNERLIDALADGIYCSDRKWLG
jgi:hypothetical protein